jgi:hypothetical protein
MRLATHTTPRGSVIGNASVDIDVDFWLEFDIDDECYCLDASSLIPAGSTAAVNSDLYMTSYVTRGRDI